MNEQQPSATKPTPEQEAALKRHLRYQARERKRESTLASSVPSRLSISSILSILRRAIPLVIGFSMIIAAIQIFISDAAEDFLGFSIFIGFPLIVVGALFLIGGFSGGRSVWNTIRVIRIFWD